MGRRDRLSAVGPRSGAAGLETARTVLPRELEIRGEPLAFAEVGAGRPLLLIHGYGGSRRWWFRLVPTLSDAGFRLVLPDLPGFGDSPGPPLPLRRAADRLCLLMDRLGVARFAVCGHSMGAAVAALIAARHGRRARRLVLIDSAGIPTGSARRAFRQLARPWVWESVQFAPTLLRDLLRAGPRNLWVVARELRSFDLSPDLPRIEAPTLLIWGARDELTPPAHAHRIAERLPGCRIEWIREARHMPMVTHPEKVAALMLDFLSDETEGRPDEFVGRG